MKDHLCSSEYVCPRMTFTGLPLCHCLLFSQLLHKAPGKHLHISTSTNIFESFYNSFFFCLFFSSNDPFQVSKQQDCLGERFRQLSNLCILVHFVNFTLHFYEMKESFGQLVLIYGCLCCIVHNYWHFTFVLEQS